GGNAVTLASDQAGAAYMAVDATNVYWTTYDDGKVMKVPIDGGTPTALATGQAGPRGIARDATKAYWTNTNGGAVVNMPLSGGAPSQLALGQDHPWGIAVDSTHVYFTNAGHMVMWPFPQYPTFEGGAVMKVPILGGSAIQLASTPDIAVAHGIAVDATNV